MRESHKIGFWTCTALVVGNVIGMGIFVLPASLAPFGYNALIGWTVVTLGCLVLARVFAYLAHALPDAEGPYGYILNTLGELPAFAAMWAYWVSLWLTNAALATGVVGYLIVVFPELGGAHSALFPLALLWLIVIVNLFGVRAGGRVQIVTTVLKLLPMLAIALLGGWVLLTAPASYVAHPPTTPVTFQTAIAQTAADGADHTITLDLTAGTLTIKIDGATVATQAAATVSSVTITGGNQINTLVGANVDSMWTLSAANTGTITGTGLPPVAFSLIQRLTGGTASDTLQAPAAGSVWTLTDATSGTVNTAPFTGMEKVSLTFPDTADAVRVTQPAAGGIRVESAIAGGFAAATISVSGAAAPGIIVDTRGGDDTVVVDSMTALVPTLAVMTGTITVAVIYIIVSAVPLLLLGQQELGAASAPFALLLERFGAAGSGRWLALFVVISGLGALNGWTLLVGELTRTMASRRVLPALLARDNRHGAPVAALLVTGLLASAMIWMSHSQSLVAAFTFLTLVVTAANLPAYLGCALALLVLWRRRTPTCASRGALLAASVGVAFVAFVFVGTGREPFLYALALCVAGLPLYALMRLRRRNAAPVEVIHE